jgi:choline dehydrogenase
MMTTRALPSADYVIVGAGTAGSVLARRLLEQTDATVLVLEAGASGDDLDSVNVPPRWVENIGAAHDWGYTYEPSEGINGRTLFISRGKVLGGSGTTNGLAWVRGHRKDFDGWGAVAPGWDYDSVLPYFRRSEDWTATTSEERGTGGPVHIDQAGDLHPLAVALIEAGQSYGMPYLEDCNVAEPLGVGPMNLTVQDGVRTSTWTGHLRPVVDHERLTIVAGAHATKLVIRDGHCAGVEVTTADGPQTITANREVILTAGAIDTPRLLMHSGIGPAEHLEQVGIDVVHPLPGVGRNLQESTSSWAASASAPSGTCRLRTTTSRAAPPSGAADPTSRSRTCCTSRSRSPTSPPRSRRPTRSPPTGSASRRA